MSKGINICVFRNDLRIQDNPLLNAALKTKRDLLPVYIWDPRQYNLSSVNSKLGTNFTPAKTWYFKFDRCLPPRMRFRVESVLDLKKNLTSHGSDLLVRYGTPEELVPALYKFLVEKGFQPVEVFIHREEGYEELQTERSLKKSIPTIRLVDGGSTLVHPDDIPFNLGDTPDIFTHFRKQVEGLEDMVREPQLVSETQKFPPFPSQALQFRENEEQISLTDLIDLNDDRSVDGKSAVPFHGGEISALERVDHYFSSQAVESYKTTRNGLVGADYSTKFSAFLAHGNISARHIYYLLKQHEEKFMKGKASKETYWVVFELLWRDFWKFLVRKTKNQVFYLEGRNHGNYRQSNSKKWSTNSSMFQKWKEGSSGVPFIDASMREIAATGYMSNRGRQNVASFLTKDLNMNWLMGAEYFESILIDHDVCSNYGNWQYSAGVGNDPREDRHFNIIKQAKDYDSKGKYVKLWVPEIQGLSEKDVHSPWTVGGVEGYPQPIVRMEMWKRHEGRENDGKKENPDENVEANGRYHTHGGKGHRKRHGKR